MSIGCLEVVLQICQKTLALSLTLHDGNAMQCTILAKKVHPPPHTVPGLPGQEYRGTGEMAADPYQAQDKGPIGIPDHLTWALGLCCPSIIIGIV